MFERHEYVDYDSAIEMEVPEGMTLSEVAAIIRQALENNNIRVCSQLIGNAGTVFTRK